MAECICTFDWDSIRPYVRFKRHPECPAHPVFYLGVQVQITEDFGDGWVRAQWPDGKLWRHWKAQLDNAPTGRISAYP